MTPSRCCAIGTILLLVSFISVTAQQQPGNCTVTDAFNCQRDFTDELNITATQNAWLDPETFRRDVERFYQRGGIDGLRRVCRAFRNYKNCLGPQYAACTSVVAYVQVVKLQPAWEYVKIFGQFHFICGAGFNTYLNNDDCMSTAWRVNFTRLENCRHQFDASVLNDAPNACYYAQQEILCYEAPFQQSCGFTARGPTWWACEYARFSSVQQYPQCGLRCTIPAVGGVVG